MLIEALIAASDLGRLHEIARVLVRHGFGDLVQRTGLARILERAGRLLPGEGKRLPPVSPAVRTRRALEELGPTFVKLGQVLASRSDLMPPDWVRELGQLHQKVAAVPFEEILPQLEQDLGAPPREIFDDLTEIPLAAGSIAQVHEARLGGRELVIKVRRPDIAEKVAADLRLLGRFADLLEQEISELRRFRPSVIVRQFARTMRAELDFQVEAKNLRAIAANLEGQADVVVPELLPEFTRERLLVMTRLYGVSAADWIAGEERDAFDTPAIAATGADVILQMVFVDGLYHADPHPGNVLFQADGRVGLLDFGMVGRLTEGRRREFVDLLVAVADRDENLVVDVLIAWSTEARPDIEALTQDCSAFLDHYHGVALGELDVTAMLVDLTTIVRENQLTLPGDVAMLIKVFVTLEGLGAALDDRFDMASHVEPLAHELVQELHSPRAAIRRNLRELRGILTGLPRDLRSLLSRARRGGFQVEFDLRRLEQFGRQIDRSANRITVGVVTAALIVGTSIAMTVDRGPKLFDLPALGLLGFASSLVIGMGLLWSILRSGKGV